MDEIKVFCNYIRERSNEHRSAIIRITDLPAIIAYILRQELDSMVRVIYLLSIPDIEERKILMRQTISGKKLTFDTKKGRQREITDREIVELSNQLQGWTRSVYKFGCAFIHLSNFHDYKSKNPFDFLDVTEKKDILSHMRNYHGGPSSDSPSFEELAIYFPMVFEKIKSNLECYLKELESINH